MENVITLGKLIDPVDFILSPPPLYFFFWKTKRNDLARPVMGTIFLVPMSRYCTGLSEMTIFS